MVTTFSTITTPPLTQIARYIPDRTLAVDAPGAEQYLGTFTTNTTPTESEVNDLTVDALAYVQVRMGSVIDLTLAVECTATVALRVAAMIELAYPRNVGDLSTYDRLLAQAADSLSLLTDINQTLTGAGSTAAQVLLPQWSMPAPWAHGDTIY